MTYHMAYAAAQDAANRRMRAAGRSVWNKADYNFAAKEFDRLWPWWRELGFTSAAAAKKAGIKRNPDAVTTFAQLASGVLSAMQINEHMKRATKKRTTKAKGRRRNPETKAEVAARMAKVRAARKNPAKAAIGPKPTTPKVKAQSSKINPRKTVKVPSKGRFYLMTVGQGDDTYGVFINDRDGDGVSKKFKTAAAAKAYATRNRLRLENPLEIQVVKPTPTLIKQLKANPDAVPNGFFSRYRAKRRAKREYGRELAYAAKIRRSRAKRKKAEALAWNPTPKPAVKKAVAKKANPTPKKKAASGGDYYLNPFIDGVYLSHGSTLGRKFPTQAAARKYAKEKGIRLRNPKAVGVAAVNPAGRLPKGAKLERRGSWWYVVNLGESRVTRARSKEEAIRQARSVVSSMKSAARKKKAAKKANPKTTARRRTFELFNGRPATQCKALPISRLAGSGKNFDQLGDLVELHLLDGTVIKTNPAQFKLVARSGRLWVAGGPLHKGPMPTRKMNPIGKLHAVVYRTYKPHHGDPKGQHYIHELGEWSGNKPNISLDNEGFAVITGGSYKIEDRGIVD